jgi:NADPH:quinone reductase-like Zn-dependent oxidoreductase
VKARGAEVFAPASRASLDTIAALGATHIDYTATTVDPYVNEHTGGDGFDVIFDTVGGTTLDPSFAAVRAYTGHVVSALGWGTHGLAPLSFRGATYSGTFTLPPLLTGQRLSHHRDILREAVALVNSDALPPQMDSRSFTFADIAAAYDIVGNGRATGKVVIDV